MNELRQDRRLHIHTIGSDYMRMTNDNYGYDPTPYSALQKLADSGLITKEDTLIDYGCGKGRVGIFLNDATGCKVIGVDCNPERIRQAKMNRQNYNGKADVHFVQAKAEQFYPIEGNCFYFFNPFSVKIFRQVLRNIRSVKQDTSREMTVFFYYPTDRYSRYLLSEDLLILKGEIDCTTLLMRDHDLYRILVFTVA